MPVSWVQIQSGLVAGVILCWPSLPFFGSQVSARASVWAIQDLLPFFGTNIPLPQTNPLRVSERYQFPRRVRGRAAITHADIFMDWLANERNCDWQRIRLQSMWKNARNQRKLRSTVWCSLVFMCHHLCLFKIKCFNSSYLREFSKLST